MILRDQ